MISQVKEIVARSQDTLMYDLGGVAALAALTVVMLYLPAIM